MGGVFSKGLPKFSLEQFPEFTKLFSKEKTNRKINQTAGPMPENSLLVQDEEENKNDGSNLVNLESCMREENQPRSEF